MAKVLSVIGTVIAITAVPVLASLLDHRALSQAPYISSLQLRGSITSNIAGDVPLRGSVR